jgi:hypothetical protein
MLQTNADILNHTCNKYQGKPGVVVHNCHPGTREVEARGLLVPGQSGPYTVSSRLKQQQKAVWYLLHICGVPGYCGETKLTYRKVVPGRGNRQCKGPGARWCLLCLKNRAHTGAGAQ